MLHRLDSLAEGPVNPVTEKPWNDNWLIFMLTDSPDYQQLCGSNGDCAYTVRTSRRAHPDWRMAAGDFISFHSAMKREVILVMSAEELSDSLSYYEGHSCSDPFLRDNEPNVLIHSTTSSGWQHICHDGMLKSWNRLHGEGFFGNEPPIGRQLGDPESFSDYVMFGGGITGEIVVNSHQQGRIVMDPDSPYTPGARLYFDAARMAADGLLLRDGCHIKVHNALPLKPYLLLAATWETLGLNSPESTPAAFACMADEHFRLIRSE